ncbi:MAG: ArnT family glycosyltransferase [Ktedonobacterales bacterium]
MSQTSSVAKKSSASSLVGWFARVPISARLAVLLCVIALALRLLPLGGIETDYDEGVYWQSLRAMSNGYPLFTSIFSSQPPFFLLSIYPLYRLFALFSGPTLAAARLAIALYSLMGLVAVYFAARMIGGRWVGLLALALLALDPFYLKESYTLQAEAPSLAWELVALALVVAASRSLPSQSARRHFLVLAGGVALGLGILVKLFDAFVLIPIVLYLLAPVTAAWYIEGNRLRFRGWDTLKPALAPILQDLGLLIAGSLLAFLVVLLPFVGSWGTLYDQVIRYHLAASQYAARTLGYNVKLLLDLPSEYPLALLALVSCLVAISRRAWVILPPLLWFLACFAFLLREQPLFDHDRILLVPPLVLLASLILYHYQPATTGLPRLSIPRMGEWTPDEMYVLLTAAVLLLTLLIGGVGAHRDAVTPLPQASVEMASALQAATLPGDLVASDDQYIAGLADRNVPPQLVDTSQVRILSGYLTASEVEAVISKYDIRVILFASGRFDLIPGFSSWVQSNFTEIQGFGGGNALYMKEPHTPQTAQTAQGPQSADRYRAFTVTSSRPAR